MKIKYYILFIMLATLSAFTFANQINLPESLAESNLEVGLERYRVEINPRDLRYQNRINLKYELQRRHGMLLGSNSLRSIEVIYYNKRSNGYLTLEVDNRYSYRYPVQVDRERGRRGHTMNSLHIPSPLVGDNYLRRLDESWILHIDGKIRIKEIILTLDNHRRDPREPRYEDIYDERYFNIIPLGKMDADKVIGSAKTFQVNQRYLTHIGVQGNKETVEVTQAYATLSNGRNIYLNQLIGYLHSGERKAQNLSLYGIRRGVYVHSVTIKGKSLNILGSRGEIYVGVATRK